MRLARTGMIVMERKHAVSQTRDGERPSAESYHKETVRLVAEGVGEHAGLPHYM